MREDDEENEDETVIIKRQTMYNYDEMEYDDRIQSILFENQFYACKLMLCIDGARGLLVPVEYEEPPVVTLSLELDDYKFSCTTPEIPDFYKEMILQHVVNRLYGHFDSIIINLHKSSNTKSHEDK